MSDNNRRNLTRIPVNQSVFVRDAIRDLEVGKLVNLHNEGFMVIGGLDIQCDCLYQLTFNMAVPVDGESSIGVGAECLWRTETGGDDQYWAGFHIIDLAEKDRPIMKKLVEEIGEG